METSRLDKLLCACSDLTRSEARAAIKAGRVKVNGKTVNLIDLKVDVKETKLSLDGRELGEGGNVYIMMNKPQGYISATEDTKEKTVLDLLEKDLSGAGLFPVGRLDKDTTGLLLLTNDGSFAHMVTSPKKLIEKVYEAKVDGTLYEEDVEAFKQGIILRDGTKCLSSVLEIDSDDKSLCKVKICEGKYHQVKRMLASRGAPVLTLKRLSIGRLKLDESLQIGEYRKINQKEKDAIFN